MSYQVLARKWRPATFDALVGQEHVLKALRHALDSERLHHAYLFTGTRGVGKTTIARILAKALTCERGVSARPCGDCAACVEIGEGRSVDLIEVDAASRTKVEDTRELLDNVQYAPTRSRFKIYLIDEVHMLSGHSFNALLKTLEEPPEHVKFLLATTDPQRLPATILSRCLQFNLKNLSAARIVEHLRYVLGEEGVGFDDGALWHLGRAAAGSMRDALSLTDQAIAYGSGSLREVDVLAMLGSVDRSHIYRLLEGLADDKPEALLDCCAAMAEQGVDFGLATDELCSVLHRIAIAQAVPAAVDPEFGDAERVTALAARFTAEDVQLFFELAQTARDRLGSSVDPRAAFEMLTLRLLAFRPVAVLDPALSAEDIVEAPALAVSEGGQEAKKSEPPPAASESEEPEPEPEPQPPACPSPNSDEPPWHEILLQLDLKGSARNIASHCVLLERGLDRWTFCLDQRSANLFNDRHQQVIAAALSAWSDRPLAVDIKAGEVRGETPAVRAAREEQERLAAAQTAIAGDPRVRQILEDFEGQVVDGSVTVSQRQ